MADSMDHLKRMANVMLAQSTSDIESEEKAPKRPRIYSSLMLSLAPNVSNAPRMITVTNGHTSINIAYDRLVKYSKMINVPDGMNIYYLDVDTSPLLIQQIIEIYEVDIVPKKVSNMGRYSLSTWKMFRATAIYGFDTLENYLLKNAIFNFSNEHEPNYLTINKIPEIVKRTMPWVVDFYNIYYFCSVNYDMVDLNCTYKGMVIKVSINHSPNRGLTWDGLRKDFLTNVLNSMMVITRVGSWITATFPYQKLKVQTPNADQVEPKETLCKTPIIPEAKRPDWYPKDPLIIPQWEMLPQNQPVSPIPNKPPILKRSNAMTNGSNVHPIGS